MRLVIGIVDLIVAVLALIGFMVVVLLLQEEIVPRYLSWWEDVQQGRAHYQAIRLERGIKEEAISAAVRTQETLDLAQQRMIVALERSRPLSNSMEEDGNGPIVKPPPAA